MPKKLTCLFLGMLLVTLAFSAFAGEKKDVPEYMPIFIYDYAVKPGEAANFEKAIKNVFAILEEANYPKPMFGFKDTVNYHYYFSYAFKNFAQLDEGQKDWAELMKKVGEEKVKKAIAKTKSYYDYVKFSTIYVLPKLSYKPENPRLKPGWDEKGGYYYWEYFYLYPDKVEQFNKVTLKFIEIHKKYKTSNPWTTASGGFGTESPVFIFGVQGKSKSDFLQAEQETWKKFKKEDQKKMDHLYQKLLSMTRKIESMEAYYRPDLSYFPKAMKEKMKKKSEE